MPFVSQDSTAATRGKEVTQYDREGKFQGNPMNTATKVQILVPDTRLDSKA
jgi:hypothetical protein